jgi:hypothetical protein
MERSKESQHTSDGGKKETPPQPTVGLPGLALVPPKVVQKILQGVFIDMHKLLPDTGGPRSRRRPAADPHGQNEASSPI